jgi:Mlc titration factor MtfA (ptsG expression regulator)
VFIRWWKQRRRRKLLARPLPDLWRATLDEVALYQRLSAAEQAGVGNYLRVFIPEKNWEGCRGFQITAEVQVIIAAQVAILVLGFGDEYFDQVQSILVYPDSYVAKDNTLTGGFVLEGQSARAGEAWHRGPVILSWPDVLADAHGDRGGHNLVLHEFAHQLDMLNGRVADGVPPMESAGELERWTRVVEREYERLVADCTRGYPPLLDCYGTKHKSEFFAVATEAFFEQPRAMQHHHQELYELFCDFYRQDPASRSSE